MHENICLTFDTEEWDPPTVFQAESEHNMSTAFSAKGCQRLLKLFEKEDTKCTFFATGTFATEQPEIIKQIHEKGHEIGCHGHNHTEIDHMDKQRLTEQVSKCIAAIKAANIKEVAGFRCPRNKINKHLYKTLRENRIEYDSSVHPAILPKRPLDVLQNPTPHIIDEVLELPISTLYGLPISWWWMRNIGTWYTKLGVDASIRTRGYCILYFHPWEYTELPKVKGIPQHITKKTGEHSVRELKKLIQHYKRKGTIFQSMRDLAQNKRLKTNTARSHKQETSPFFGTKQ